MDLGWGTLIAIKVRKWDNKCKIILRGVGKKQNIFIKSKKLK